MRSTLLAAVASIGLVGCVGELDTMGGGPGSNVDGDGTNPNPNPDSLARGMFEQDVYPIITGAAGASSNCLGCHSLAGGVSTGFVAPNLADAYAAITSYQVAVGNFSPADAGILTYIVPPAAPHYAQSYTPDQVAKITAWLDREVIERSNTPTAPTDPTVNQESPSQATNRVRAEWSACMDYADFTQANMANRWGNLTANNNQRCSACHATGGEGFIATPQSQFFFDVISQNKYYMLQYFTVDLSDLTRGPDGKLINAQMKINYLAFEGVARGQDPHREHPRFNPTNNNGMTALNTFYNATMQRVQNQGTTPCGPSKLTN
jgi:hypothetical protein